MRDSDIGLMEGIDKEWMLDAMADELPALRAKVGFTQDDLCEIVGISRTQLSMVENRKQKLQWSTFMSILLFFYQHDKTKKAVEVAGLMPDKLKEVLDVNLRTD